MAITQERKNELITEFKIHENDTGSADVQIAILTEEINNLTDIYVLIRKTTTHVVDFIK